MPGPAPLADGFVLPRSPAHLHRDRVVRQLQISPAASIREWVCSRNSSYRIQHGENTANCGGLEYSERRFPGYWEVTSLYAVARALGAECILDLEGVYVELRAVSSDEAAELPRHAVEQAVTKAFGFLRYHRMALAEAVLGRSGDEFRLLIYSEFLRRYEDPEWNLAQVSPWLRKPSWEPHLAADGHRRPATSNHTKPRNTWSDGTFGHVRHHPAALRPRLILKQVAGTAYQRRGLALSRPAPADPR